VIISDVVVSPGVTGFYFDDQAAIKKGEWVEDGFTYRGDPCTKGFHSIRQAGESISIQLILEDGQTAWGDCAAVQYSGCGGRDPLFLAKEYIPIVEDVVRRHFIGETVTSFRSLSQRLEELRLEDGRRLHTASRYGISQALLDAAAKASHCTMAEVAAKEFRVPLINEPVPIFTQSGDDRYIHVDRMILKRADVLPHGLFNNLDRRVGSQGEKLLQYVRWLRQRVEFLGEPSYCPVFHIDVYGTLGDGFPDMTALLDYLERLGEAARPHMLRIEGPIDRGNRAAQIDTMAALTAELDRRGRPVEIVADEWCNTLADIQMFARARAGHLLQIKTPDLGSIDNSMAAVLFCREHDMGAYLGGTCNETDRSAQVCVHAALATRPCQMLAKPGMGVDEGFTIVYNEMQRVMAYLKRKEERRAHHQHDTHSGCS